MSDGTVEIAITGRLDQSVAASAGEAKTTIGGVADATTTAAATARSAAASTVDQAAAFTTATTAIHGNTIAMRESLVVGRELLSGNLTRLPGSLSILATQFTTSGKSAGEFATTILKSFGLIKVTQDAELAGLAASAAATANVITQTALRAGAAITAADAEVLLAEAALREAEGTEAEAVAQNALAAAHQRVAIAAREATVAEAALAEANVGVAATARTAAAAESIALGPIAIIAGIAVAVGSVALAMHQYDEEMKQLEATSIGLGSASRATAEDLEALGQEAADSSGQSVKESTKAAEAFAAAGVRDQGTIEKLSASVETYAQLTGVKFADAQKTLAEAMQDPIKGAEELHQQLGILDGDQMQQIERLTAMGDKDQAVAVLVKALTDRTNEANQAGVGFSGTLGQISNGLSNMWNWLGRVTDRLPGYIDLMRSAQGDWISGSAASTQYSGSLEQQTKAQTQLNIASARGADIFKSTPEGQAIAQKTELIGKVNQLRQAVEADTKLHGAHSDAVRRDKGALEDYTHAVNSYLTPVEKKLKADSLDVQLAAAKHSHNKQLVADLSEQKALLEQSGKIESDNDARTLARSKGDVAGARTFAPKGPKTHGPDIVSEWEEQLHAAEVASNDFFHEQTANELAFWQGKVALTKSGSKDWLAVQSKIYDAQKELAHQNYDEHIADLNDQLQADRDNWKKEQADWDAKLAYIADHFGKESTEYKDAHRDFQAQERDHQKQMLQAERDGEQKQLEALKSHLQAEQQIRAQFAQTAETVIRDQSDRAILGEATAAARIGQLHAQLAQEELASAEATYAAEDALRQQAITRAETTYTQDSKQYKEAVAAKALADQQYYDQKAQLEARAHAQEINDLLAVKQAYSNLIGGTVNATIQGFDGMISRTQNWRQAAIGIYQSVVSSFETGLQKMVTKWIVEHAFMTAAQRAQLAIQNAQHGASEVAKTAATTGGVAARSGVENTGFFAQMLRLLGINLGAHVGTETSKTAATATGAATRATAETTAATTSAASQIAANVTTALSYVGVAGAAGTASFAAAPWPIDMGAPAFGASMASAAAGYASLASLDVGTNLVPNDMVAQIHEGERVIPKADNRKLIEMMGMASGGVDGGGGRTDVHLHYSPNIHERERLDMRQLLSSGGGDMLTFIRQAVRDGKLKLQPA